MQSNNGEYAWIEDGCTRDGYIARRPGLHPAVSFTFRPMIQPERARAKHSQETAKTPEESEMIAATEIARRVIEWDVVKPNGEPVPLDAKSVIRLNGNVFYDMWSQVLGTQASDAKPDGSNPEDVLQDTPEGDAGN